MARKPVRKRGAWADLASLLWKAPLFAIPFALFFLLVTGQPLRRLWLFYEVSLVFSGAASLSVWFTRHVVESRVIAWRRGRPHPALYVSATYVVTSLLGTLAAAVILHYTLLPGIFGGARAIVTMLVYSLLFCALFMGISLAVSYYREAMERAGSDRELQLARRIQRSFLLSEFPRRSRLEVHATNVSSKEVSGDFYDVVPVGDADVLLAVADVSGKGVPAALLSSMLQASLRTQAGAVASPAAMMRTINTLACQRVSTGQFATFFLAAIHEPSMTLRFTNAGHNFPVLLRASGERVLLERGGSVVGMLERLAFEEEALALRPGDRLVLYTDGVTEAARADGEMFGELRLYALLDAAPAALSAEQLVDRVLEGVREFLGEMEAGDDITVMAVRVLDPSAPARP